MIIGSFYSRLSSVALRLPYLVPLYTIFMNPMIPRPLLFRDFYCRFSTSPSAKCDGATGLLHTVRTILRPLSVCIMDVSIWTLMKMNGPSYHFVVIIYTRTGEPAGSLLSISDGSIPFGPDGCRIAKYTLDFSWCLYASFMP